tara:strand:+ start:80749 stop:83559 length:2811 start_codon:yes stop_codon:yes gene_type:complete
MLHFLKKTFFFFCVTFCFSQELPPINNYAPIAYNGGNQNWSISQSDQNYIYVGNNSGLLEFNGATWKTYSSPNGSHIRSVMVVNNIIYTGCYMEFGFWEKDSFGSLSYQSLKPKLKTPMIEDEEFWNIIQLDRWILFQSLQRIYVYNLEDESFSIIDAESTRARIFKNNGTVYFQETSKGLFKIEDGKGVLVSDDSIFKTNIIIGLFQAELGKIIVTEKDGFFVLVNGKLKKWEIPINKQLQGVNVYSSEQLKDGNFILGTISDGVYYIDSSGQLIEKINQKKGLFDNTVHSVFEDVEGNIWLALNNGISVINLSSPFNEYLDKIGKLGVVYTASVYKNHLYLGTNQGLFYKTKEGDDDFKIIENTNGQVWILKEIDDILFCGHNNGTFIVEGDKVKNISSFPGTWDIKKIPGMNSLLIQGNYKGLSVLEKVNNQWVFRNKVDGFDISSRFFEFTKNNDVIVNHEFKGVFRLTLDTVFKKVNHIIEKAVMGTGASLVTYKGNILYTSNNGVFRYDESLKEFKTDSLFTNLFFDGEEQPIGIIIPDTKSDRLWSFTDKNIIAVSPNKFNGNPEAKKIAIPNSFRRSIGVMGFENIKSIGKNNYLIGISNGYITLDLGRLKSKKYAVSITTISSKHTNSTVLEKVDLNSDLYEFGYKRNNLYFQYSVPNYDKYTEVNFQYQLIGLSEQWSTWSENPEVSFENLPFGEYTFNVRSKVGNDLSENEAAFSFEILRPWYASNVAIVLYTLFLCAIAYIIHRLYRRYYRRQQELLLKENQKKLKRKKIKAEKKLIQIKNEKLNQEIDNKSRELAISTMSIIKKNEFLNNIKSQLQESGNSNQINVVIKTIDRNINNEDDWKFFEDAFNNADKEFLKKIKNIHPELTPNDLRLCAYLRLNLSSKEIAPLLNISVRSVEVKRYRLRKKMALPHENSLTTYILNL